MTTDTPETAAGRKLDAHLAALVDNEGTVSIPSVGEVKAVEREARALGRAEALAAVRAAVEAMEPWSVSDRANSGWIKQAYVLAAIDNLEKR